MNSREFLKNLYKTGDTTPEEISKFMLKNYFLKGLTLEDFESDMIKAHTKHESYAKSLADCFRAELKKYSK